MRPKLGTLFESLVSWHSSESESSFGRLCSSCSTSISGYFRVARFNPGPVTVDTLEVAQAAM
jgi:hypothetical protein